ncbi:TPA: hypothetical protein QA897_000792 [Shigella flexneri]|nr:hypothetical protein [Shigella flexneri]
MIIKTLKMIARK